MDDVTPESSVMNRFWIEYFRIDSVLDATRSRNRSKINSESILRFFWFPCIRISSFFIFFNLISKCGTFSKLQINAHLMHSCIVCVLRNYVHKYNSILTFKAITHPIIRKIDHTNWKWYEKKIKIPNSILKTNRVRRESLRIDATEPLSNKEA